MHAEQTTKFKYKNSLYKINIGRVRAILFQKKKILEKNIGLNCQKLVKIGQNWSKIGQQFHKPISLKITRY